MRISGSSWGWDHNKLRLICGLLWAASPLTADQPSWTGSHFQMQEFGEGDELPLQHLSVSELSLVRKITSKERAYGCHEADFQSLRVRRLELGARGKKFLAIAGGSACLRGGNVPNYAFWIAETTGSNHAAQIEEWMFSFAILKTSAHGQMDILTYEMMGHRGGAYTRYSFNGDRYLPVECFLAQYGPDVPPEKALKRSVCDPR